MKKATFILMLTLAFLSHTSFGQNLIAVHHQGTPAFYTTMSAALGGAVDGDTIYIPGGTFDAINIDKRLHLIGVGHHPDSTDATSRTYIKGITLSSGCSGGSLSGIFTHTYPISINSDLDNYRISRNYIFSLSNVNSINLTNICIDENVIISGLYLSLYNYFVLANNIILGGVVNAHSGIIRNNVLLKSPNGLSANNCTIENNFFSGQFTNVSYCTNSIINNNVNAGINGADVNGNQGSGNYLNQGDISSFFVNYDPATVTLTNIYEADFHLVPGSPYINAGRDGTDIGIYGGAYPWKDGSIPFNPHIQSINISPVTNSSGNLNVNIQVEAQDR